MNKLAISSAARKGLEEIKPYISDELENPTVALNVLARIEERTYRHFSAPICPLVKIQVLNNTGLPVRQVVPVQDTPSPQ